MARPDTGLPGSVEYRLRHRLFEAGRTGDHLRVEGDPEWLGLRRTRAGRPHKVFTGHELKDSLVWPRAVLGPCTSSLACSWHTLWVQLQAALAALLWASSRHAASWMLCTLPLSSLPADKMHLRLYLRQELSILDIPRESHIALMMLSSH